MKLEVNKIITLGNDEEYLVVDKVLKDDKEYYYIAQVNDEETDTGLLTGYDSKKTDIKDNYKIVCATYKDGNVYLDEVLGEDKLKSILPLFVKE